MGVKLSVKVDGAAMPEAEARAFWTRFSEHMESHHGDLAGFAKAEGFATVKPGIGTEGPELVLSRTGVQVPYGSKTGSPPVHGGGRGGLKTSQKRRRR